MSRIEIDFAVVNQELQNYNNAYGEIVTLMSQIDSSYFNAMATIWNTTTAHKYFTSFIGAMNETIDKMNTGFSVANENVQSAARHVSEAEGGIQVQKISTPRIKSMSLLWTGKDAKITISDNIGEETNNHFTTPMKQIEDKLEECKTSMETIRNIGLSDYISGSAIASIVGMINSAKQVAAQYTNDAVKNAATQDANARNYRMQH